MKMTQPKSNTMRWKVPSKQSLFTGTLCCKQINDMSTAETPLKEISLCPI
ncbi:hypothetical protein OAG51_02895 [Pirellulaceae bacterium]|nr:hypothetical protein [Pirellulaceae bacterium]